MSTTPLMQMDLPTVGVDSGTVGNNKYVAAFNVIDGHDHTSGKGTQVPTAGININSGLSFNSFSGTNFRSTNFASQGGVFSSSSDNRSVYVVGNELYFRDGAGNNVQLTSSGSVAGTSGSIGGLSSPAVASFSTNTFIWKSDATTFAKMRNADVELYPATAGASSAITLKSPALSGSYTLTLPNATPASNQYLQMDTSGNVTTVTADSIASAATSTGANSLANLYTRPTAGTGSNPGARGVARANNVGAPYATTAGWATITGLSVALTTNGRPVAVFLGCAPSFTPGGAFFGAGTVPNSFAIRITRDGTPIFQYSYYTNTSSDVLPPPGWMGVDVVSSGTYTYAAQAITTIGGPSTLTNLELVVVEL